MLVHVLGKRAQHTGSSHQDSGQLPQLARSMNAMHITAQRRHPCAWPRGERTAEVPHLESPGALSHTSLPLAGCTLDPFTVTSHNRGATASGAISES